jgi:hypothetical protein
MCDPAQPEAFRGEAVVSTYRDPRITRAMEVSVWPKGYIFSCRSSVIRVTNWTLDGLLSNGNVPTILFLFSQWLKRFHEMFGLSGISANSRSGHLGPADEAPCGGRTGP